MSFNRNLFLLLLAGSISVMTTCKKENGKEDILYKLQENNWSFSENGTDREPFLSFEDSSKVTGFGGCNSLFADYELLGDTIHFIRVGSTRKYCAETSAAENELIRQLQGKHKLIPENDYLILRRKNDIRLYPIPISEKD